MLFDLLVILILYAISLAASVHILLHKQDPRAALGWMAVSLGLPGFGALFYWLFGRNRIRTRARAWQNRGEGIHLPEGVEPPEEMPAVLRAPFKTQNYVLIRQLSDAVTRRPLVDGNRVEILLNGEQAYPAMLAAIQNSNQFLDLSSYIFDTHTCGNRFASALIEAAERGVEVRVLVDALGEMYTMPRIRSLFKGTKVQFSLFLPFSLSQRGLHINLRNHRKLLVVDGEVGFTGGMNISTRHNVNKPEKRKPVADIHFKFFGPVVGHMQASFMEDWHFATGESMNARTYPKPVQGGASLCRGVSAGPNENFEKLVWIVSGALTCARNRVCIMTPYFVPDQTMIAALCGAALRGVKVEIILPEENNLPFVAGASRANFSELLRYGIEIMYQPGFFVHSKLLLMDEHYALIGSANMDARSHRLNFEFNVEIYDKETNRSLRAHFNQARENSRRISLDEIEKQPLICKLGDRFLRLFSPFL
ncbi:MAG: cardiolipin synthase [Desulfuromonadaceae bacterium]